VNSLVKIYYDKMRLLTYSPQIREQGSITVLGEFAYLYGGLSNGIKSDMNVFDLYEKRWHAVE